MSIEQDTKQKCREGRETIKAEEDGQAVRNFVHLFNLRKMKKIKWNLREATKTVFERN